MINNIFVKGKEHHIVLEISAACVVADVNFKSTKRIKLVHFENFLEIAGIMALSVLMKSKKETREKRKFDLFNIVLKPMSR